MVNFVKRLATVILVSIITMANCPTAVVANATTSVKDGRIENVILRTYKKTIGYAPQNAKYSDINVPEDVKLPIERESGDYFLVTYSDRKVWIKTNDVLINISQYIPSLEIDLAMAREENLFTMGDEKIPGITDKKFYYELGSENGCECYLRYQAAKKLLKAQKQFLKDGYSIKIYDAYRPYSVSVAFKDAYHIYLTGKSQSFKNKWFGQLGESWFLAQKPGSHNYGIAVDMTLVNSKTGKELLMPAAMHTLDVRSARYVWEQTPNSTSTKNAQYMRKVMMDNGFSDLKSEWWHFQDNENVNTDIIDIQI